MLLAVAHPTNFHCQQITVEICGRRFLANPLPHRPLKSQSPKPPSPLSGGRNLWMAPKVLPGKDRSQLY